MTELQILEKAIKQSGHEYPMKLSGVPFDNYNAMYSIIFSHKFAKQFWGEEDEIEVGRITQKIMKGESYSYPSWQYHLQIMVLEERPIEYLKQFLK